MIGYEVSPADRDEAPVLGSPPMACALWISLSLASDPSMRMSASETREKGFRTSSLRECFLKRGSVCIDPFSRAECVVPKCAY